MTVRRAFLLGCSLVAGVVAVAALTATLTDIARSGGGSRAPAAEGASSAASIAALAQPRTARDVLPAAAARELQAIVSPPESVPSAARPGALRFDASRILLAELGPHGADLYAVPTDKGQVCVILTGVGSGCEDKFTHSPIGWTAIDPDTVGAGEPLTLYGIAPDAVRRIDVVVDGDRSTARLANNGFYYRLSSAEQFPSRLVVHFADGREEMIELNDPRTR